MELFRRLFTCLFRSVKKFMFRVWLGGFPHYFGGERFFGFLKEDTSKERRKENTERRMGGMKKDIERRKERNY